MIQVFVRGEVRMQRGCRMVSHGTGELIGFDLCERLDSLNSDFDLSYAMIPRRSLAPLLSHPDSVHGVCVLPEIGAGRIAARFLTDLHATASRLSKREGEILANALIELVALAFSGANLQPGDGTREARYADLLAAQAAVRDTLDRPELGPDSLASDLGVSRTVLYTMFKPIGGVAAARQATRGSQIRTVYASRACFWQ